MDPDEKTEDGTENATEGVIANPVTGEGDSRIDGEVKDEKKEDGIKAELKIIPEKQYDVSGEWSKIFEKDKLKELVDSIPDLAQYIMQEYNNNKNIEIRARLKSTLNYLLKIASTNTESPNKSNKGALTKSRSSFQLGNSSMEEIEDFG